MFSNWDVFDLIGWGALLVVLLLVAALVTYLVKSWGRRGRRADADRRELEELRARAARQEEEA